MQGLGVNHNNLNSQQTTATTTTTTTRTFLETRTTKNNIILDQTFHNSLKQPQDKRRYATQTDIAHELFETFNKNITTSKSTNEMNYNNDTENLTNQSNVDLESTNRKNNDVNKNGISYIDDDMIISTGRSGHLINRRTRIVGYSSDEDNLTDNNCKDNVDTASDDTLSQREELSSSDESSVKSDCDTPCGIGLLERLIRTHPVWFLPGIQRAGAFHLLQGKEEGNFVIRQSSQPDTMAISVRLPLDKGPYIEHYLIQSQDGQLSLESSENRFDSIPSLIVHYSQCCDELPVQLCLPRTIREARNRQQLTSLALLGQEFWRYPMANPRPPEGHSLDSSQSNSLSSNASGNNNNNNNKSNEKTEIVLDLVPLHQEPPTPSLMTTFKGTETPTLPTKATRPNTLDLISHNTCETSAEAKSQALVTSPLSDRLCLTPSGKTPPPPPPRWTKPSPGAGNQGHVSITTTVTFNMNEMQVSCVQLTPTQQKSLSLESDDNQPSLTSLNISSPSSDRSLSFDQNNPRIGDISSPISDQTNLKSKCYDRDARLQQLISPVSDKTNLGSSARKRHHRRAKESRHYQESDILESPNVYYRSPLGDRQSDYEDIWNSEPFSTFKPLKSPEVPKKTPDLLERLDRVPCPQTPIDVKENRSPFYAEPADAVKSMVLRRKLQNTVHSRHSDPSFSNVPFSYLTEGTVLEKIESQGDLNKDVKSSVSVDNLTKSTELKVSRNVLRQSCKSIRGKPVLPPKIGLLGVGDQSWPVDSSWEFIGNEDDEDDDEEVVKDGEGKFPTIEQQMDSEDSCRFVTVHNMIAQRFPHLKLSQAQTQKTMQQTISNISRFSAYDNLNSRQGSDVESVVTLRQQHHHQQHPKTSVLDSLRRRGNFDLSATEDDETQTVFSEPWDSSRWENLLLEPWEVCSDTTIKVGGGDAVLNTDEDETVVETPARQRSVSRIKSFKERLDPLISPPRLAALRNREFTGTGSGIRAYALHLASDKSTTFAQNIENFISCTLESKETSPQIVMRNMRQFMSGMKNYLVKHGEREFEKHVEKERMKLKSTEFLNLDAILEGVMHKLVVRPLKEHLYKLFVDEYTKTGAIELLLDNINYARTKPIHELGIRAKITPPSGYCLEAICQLLTRLQEVDSPLEKLEHLLSCISTIFNSVKSSNQGKPGITLGADDFLPLFVWVLVQSGFVAAEIEAEYMWGLLHPSLLSGEGGYYLTTLSSAVHVLKNFKTSDENFNNGVMSNDRWICPESRSVLKIVVPDELHGSILTKTLPVRPNMTTKDVCKIIAHKVRITNPQDYGLFKLVDGEETLLNDTECPQDVKCNTVVKGKHCILAYKRIDAKIAWPRPLTN